MPLKIILLLVVFILIAACDRSDIVTPDDDGFPPSTPEGIRLFRARDGETGIEWEQNPEHDLLGYYIYRKINDNPDLALHDSTELNYYFDYPLHYDSIFTYAISAYDKSFRESGISASVSGQPANKYAPFVPLYPEASGRNDIDSTFISLHWTPRGDADIKGYIIYRSTLAGFETENAEKDFFSINTSYNDVSVEPGIQYYYRIKALDKGDLLSNATLAVSDLALDRPEILFPLNGAAITELNTIKILTCSYPAWYKLVLYSDPVYGIISETDFYFSQIREEIDLDGSTYYLETYNKYYLRLIAFSKESGSANSYTELISFEIVPD